VCQINRIPKTSEGNYDFKKHKLINVGEPLTNNDATNKGYVDELVRSVSHSSVVHNLELSSSVTGKIEYGLQNGVIFLKGTVKISRPNVSGLGGILIGDFKNVIETEDFIRGVCFRIPKDSVDTKLTTNSLSVQFVISDLKLYILSKTPVVAGDIINFNYLILSSKRTESSHVTKEIMWHYAKPISPFIDRFLKLKIGTLGDYLVFLKGVIAVPHSTMNPNTDKCYEAANVEIGENNKIEGICREYDESKGVAGEVKFCSFQITNNILSINMVPPREDQRELRFFFDTTHALTDPIGLLPYADPVPIISLEKVF
jgi:hypothetical protein